MYSFLSVYLSRFINESNQFYIKNRWGFYKCTKQKVIEIGELANSFNEEKY